MNEVYCTNCKFLGSYLGSASLRCTKARPYKIKNSIEEKIVMDYCGSPDRINKNNDCKDFEQNKIGWLRDFINMFKGVILF